ncbi:MAG: VWA domain-containing protein [Pyrinomonadaceae bacterium]
MHKLDDGSPTFVARVLSLRWARHVNRQRALVGALLLLWTLLLLRAGWVNAQAQTQPGRADDEIVRVQANLVNLDLTVKDKKGHYITDLKAEDFTVYEDGVPQQVLFFDPPLAGSNNTTQPAPVADAAANTKTNVAPPTRPRAPAGVPRNIISLVLDEQTTEQTNLKQVREGTLTYIRERIDDSDAVAVFAIAGGLQLLQPFTQDKARLLATVERAYGSATANKNFEQRDLAAGIAQLSAAAAGAPDALAAAQQADSPAAQAAGSTAAQALVAAHALQQFQKLRTALSLQQSRPILAALAAICEALRDVPGKKTLVLFSQGFVAPEVLDWQVRSTIDIANRANVAIYIIDSGGLSAGRAQARSVAPTSPLANVSAITSQRQRIEAVGGETAFDLARQEGLNREQDILYQISGDTGGQFFKGTNDIGRGLARIDEEIHARYTLGYHSTNPNFDGSFRKLKLVVNRPGLEVNARSGFYAIAHNTIVPLSPDDKKLLANLATAEANPALPLFVELSAFRTQAGRYVVPLAIELPPAALKFEHKSDRQRLQLDVLGVVREPPDQILSRLGGSFDAALTAEQYQSILNNNIFYRQDVELAPGTYSVDVIIRDRLAGKLAARRMELVLPEPDDAFAISDVILSRHAEPSGRLATEAAELSDPLSAGGVKIRPAPSREFRPTDDLIIYCQLYNPALNAETKSALVRVTVTLMRDNQAATRPVDYVLTETQPEPVPHLTFAKYISLAKLPAGKYTALVEARDMVTRKLIKQQQPFIITQ